MTPLTRTELVARFGYFNAAVRRMLRLFVLILVAGIPTIGLPLWLRAGGSTLFIAITLWGLALLAIFATSPSDRPRRYGLACPLCGKVWGRMGAQIAIGTGRCMICGEVVLQDEGPPLFDADPLVQRITAFAKRASRFLLASLFLGLLAPILLVFLSRQGSQGNRLQAFILPWILLFPIAIGFIANMVVRHRARLNKLVCIHCGEPLSAMPTAIIAASGRCGNCGRSLGVAA